MKIKKRHIIIIILCFIALISIRFFEKKMFYDPFLQFFKLDYLSKEPPVFNLVKLIFSTFFRFALNAIFSIAILMLFFGKKVFRFSVYFYVTALFVLFGLYTLLLFNLEKDLYMLFFYVRRFLIQPLFLLLLLPAFYYQEKLKNN